MILTSMLLLTFVSLLYFKSAAGYLSPSHVGMSRAIFSGMMPPMMPPMMPGSVPGMQGVKPNVVQPVKPKQKVDIKMGDHCTFEGPMELLQIMHENVPHLMKQTKKFKYYSVYIEMKTGHHYLSDSLVNQGGHESVHHIVKKATTHLEGADRVATNFEIFNPSNPPALNKQKYVLCDGLIYVAIKRSTDVYRAYLTSAGRKS
ncbi:uncharacterized protein LOC117178854 isoform X2 [Belonocnema kinseyi]|nr:uncharacterized protein LOC117178854 isoform X2 [Belonocnema kinseyi]